MAALQVMTSAILKIFLVSSGVAVEISVDRALARIILVSSRANNRHECRVACGQE